MKEEKPPIPRRLAIFISILLVIAIIFALYFLFWGMKAGVSNPALPAQSAQPERNWELSPLVKQYSISSTPVLVINCKYILIGTSALSEQKGTVAEGTERNTIGRALCTITNSSTFCNVFQRGSGVPALNTPECKGNKTLIYAFHSPSCPYSSAQRDVLDAMSREFPGQLDVEYVCTPVHQGDMEACSNAFLFGNYAK